MEIDQARKLSMYSGMSLGAVLVMAFVLVQPTMNQAYAVGIAGGLPPYDNCNLRHTDSLEDPISMNTVIKGHTVKTVHAEKELFTCYLDQGNLEVIVDLTTYLEVYENITTRELLATNAVSTTCLKYEKTATVIDCWSNNSIPTNIVPVGANCREQTDITHPQEMDTVKKKQLVKTIEAQKEVFLCDFDGFVLENGKLECETFGPGADPECFDPEKKVDIVLFTEVYEDLNTRLLTDVQFLSATCVVLIGDDGGDFQDAAVESCVFTQIPN